MNRGARLPAGVQLAAFPLAAFLLAAPPARAAPRATVVDAGEITADSARPAPDTERDRSLTGRNLLDGIRYVSHVRTLDGALCLRFGVTLRLAAAAGEVLPGELTVLLRHPRLTRPDGATSTEDSFPAALDDDGTVYAGYSFDQGWEVRAGDWTFVFMSGDDVVATETFRVSVPAPGASVCGGPPVS